MTSRLQVLNLLEIMNHYNVWQLGLVFTFVKEAEIATDVVRLKGIGDTPVPRERCENYYEPMLKISRRQMELLELDAAVDRCDHFAKAVRDGLTYTDLNHQLVTLRQAIEDQLPFRRFAFVPVAKAKIYDPINRTWEQVWARFPKVKYDTEQAVDCFVLNLNTACVFHFMRVVEYGLRALAREMKVKLPKGKQLEWAQWQEILREMAKKADTIAATKKAGRSKDEALEFYRGALGEFHAFKDVYRNSVMHTHQNYDEFQAASAMSHVLDFMKRLAAKIDENGKRNDQKTKSAGVQKV